MKSLIFFAATALAAKNPSPVGANIGGIADYAFTMPTVDVTKQSRAWGSAAGPWDGKCVTGPDGWPAQSSFGNVFVTFSDAPLSPNAAGNWSIGFTGKAVVTPFNAVCGSAFIADQQYDASSDTTTAMLVIPSVDCSSIMLSFTNASTVAGGAGLKDIKVLQPGYTLAQAGDWTTPFLTMMAKFDIMRTMDWSFTNGSPQTEWATRPQPTAYSYALAGAPWEAIIELSNALMIDVHINVPHMATDDYILQLAKLFAAQHNPALNIHVEYSNEVWNWGFTQADYNLAQANISVTQDGDPHHFNDTRLDGGGNEGYWAFRRHVYMVMHIGEIFGGVFGAANVGLNKRVRPVYAWQCGGTHDEGFQYIDVVFSPPSMGSIFHSMAAAPYIPIGDADNSPTLTVDEVIAGWASSAANISLAGPSGGGGPNYLSPMAATASYWGVMFQGYEGGPDTVEGLNVGQPLWAKANASIDPRIAPIITDYLHSWASYGNQMGPLNYYAAGAGPLQDPYGIYSTLYDMNVPRTPKTDGIDAARAVATPISPLIPSVPTTAALNASFFAGHPIPAQPNGFFGWPPAPMYALQAATPFTGSVTVTAGTDNTGNQTMLITLGSVGSAPKIVNVTCPSSGNWQTYVPCASATLDFPAGVSTLRITRGSIWLGSISVTKA